jgi:PAT family beta-lactamase induction signal transducer AmpG
MNGFIRDYANRPAAPGGDHATRRRRPAALHEYLNRRMAVLLALGFASGLPLALTGDALQAWMKDAGIDTGKIGLFAIVGLPYVLKFAWSPIMDRYCPPMLGRRRGWLLVTQALLMLAIAAMSFCRPERSLTFLAAGAMLVAFVSASQDIVTDAYRADLLPAEERGAGAAVAVAGYRLGMIASGAGALMLAGGGWSWRAIYLLMAGSMAVGLIATLLAPTPTNAPAPPKTLADAVVHPLRQLTATRGAWVVLAFVFLFKAPEYMAAGMTVPFMLDIGVHQADLGAVKQGLGVVVMIVGALAGGKLVARIGMWRSLWVMGILHSVSNLAFCAMAFSGPRYGAMIATIGIENSCVGLTTAGFAAFLMSRCDARYSATQYALLTGIAALSRIACAMPGGYIAAHTGWPMFFALSAAAGIPGVAMLPFLTECASPADEEYVNAEENVNAVENANASVDAFSAGDAIAERQLASTAESVVELPAA